MLPFPAVDPISERLEANTNCLHSVADKMNDLLLKSLMLLVLLSALPSLLAVTL